MKKNNNEKHLQYETPNMKKTTFKFTPHNSFVTHWFELPRDDKT